MFTGISCLLLKTFFPKYLEQTTLASRVLKIAPVFTCFNFLHSVSIFQLNIFIYIYIYIYIYIISKYSRGQFQTKIKASVYFIAEEYCPLVKFSEERAANGDIYKTFIITPNLEKENMEIFTSCFMRGQHVSLDVNQSKEVSRFYNYSFKFVNSHIVGRDSGKFSNPVSVSLKIKYFVTYLKLRILVPLC